METKITDSQTVSEDVQGNLSFRDASLLKVLNRMASLSSDSHAPKPKPAVLIGL